MDVYEKAAYYTSVMERVQPDLSRVERASRVLAVLEMEFKASKAQGQSAAKQAVKSEVVMPASQQVIASDKRASFNALVRQSPDMSTYQLASAIGVSQSTASRWKRDLQSKR